MSTYEDFVLHCGGCDSDVTVTHDQFHDTALHVVPHVGCEYAGGVDLDHARRHGDWLPAAEAHGFGEPGRVGGGVSFDAERLDDGSVIFKAGDRWMNAPKLLADTFRPSERDTQ